MTTPRINDLSTIAQQVADVLEGQCMRDIADALEDLEHPSELIDNIEFCQHLDGLVFKCETCEWWCNQEENRGDENKWICEDCS